MYPALSHGLNKWVNLFGGKKKNHTFAGVAVLICWLLAQLRH